MQGRMQEAHLALEDPSPGVEGKPSGQLPPAMHALPTASNDARRLPCTTHLRTLSPTPRSVTAVPFFPFPRCRSKSGQ